MGEVDGLLRRGASHLPRLKVSQLVARCRPGAVQFHVGPSYDHDPAEWGRAVR